MCCWNWCCTGCFRFESQVKYGICDWGKKTCVERHDCFSGSFIPVETRKPPFVFRMEPGLIAASVTIHCRHIQSLRNPLSLEVSGGHTGLYWRDWKLWRPVQSWSHGRLVHGAGWPDLLNERLVNEGARSFVAYQSWYNIFLLQQNSFSQLISRCVYYVLCGVAAMFWGEEPV